MKAKYILLSILCISICTTAEAQILKKLKKKAQQAAERTLIKKTEELVAGTTEKTIDDVTTGNEKTTESENTTEVENTADVENTTEVEKTSSNSDALNNSEQRNLVSNPLMNSGKNASKNLPDTYTFEWEFKTKIETTGKKKSQNTINDMNYFISSNNDYYAIEYVNEDLKKSGGTAIMVFDFPSEAMVIFNESDGNKMGMINKLKDPKKKEIKDKDRNYTYKEIGTKTILGYECYGIEIENSNSKSTLYFTLDAPVNFSAFFAFSSEAAPKGFSDPQLFDILKEEALLMEMEMISKNKNQSMKMTPISLEEKNREFHKKDYEFMKMGF